MFEWACIYMEPPFYDVLGKNMKSMNSKHFIHLVKSLLYFIYMQLHKFFKILKIEIKVFTIIPLRSGG